MGFRWGFKTEARNLAAAVRLELEIDSFAPLDVDRLADWLAIPIWPLSAMVADASAIGHLLEVETEAFSAVTVFNGPRRTIVHNDGHAWTRQRSNIAHELSHALLQHPPAPALDDRGCRIWNDDIEDEASWLAGCLLLPEEVALAVAFGRYTTEDAAALLQVSVPMVRYRVNATGARVRVRRSRPAA